MKKILIFIDWFLPGYKAGGPIRSYANLIDHFKGEYQFYIVTRDTDYTETDPYPNIIPDSWTIFEPNVLIWYCSESFPSRKNFKKIINDTSWDILYINGIYSWYFSILPLQLGRKLSNGRKVIVSIRGMLKQSAINVKQTKKEVFIKFIKKLGWYKNITLHATNEDEKQEIIENIGNNLKIHIAPNLPRKVNGELKKKEKHPESLNLISIARISPEKNTLFALEILKKLSKHQNIIPPPHNTKHETQNTKHEKQNRLHPPSSGLQSAINHQLPNINFDLYGSIYNEQYWQECQLIISELPPWINITYHGPIDSNEVLTKFSESHFMFMPTRGENFGHVVLESFSAGCPVIISNQTPWKKLDEKEVGWDLALTNPNSYVETILNCLNMDQELYNTMSETAYNFAQEVINDPAVFDANRALFT